MGHVFPYVKTLGTLSLLLGISGCSALLGSAAPSVPGEPLGTAPPKAAETSPVVSASTSSAQTSSPANAGTSQEESVSPDDQPVRDYFREGVNRASSAVAIGQSAQSQDDWTLAASRWQQAVDLLEQVPTVSPDYGQAQTKIQEYQNHLTAAQKKATPQTTAPSAVQNTPQRPDGLVAQIPIQKRHGGTPVVAVTMKGLNGTETFPMLFDTGATGTLITAEMADALGVVIVDETQARIADGSVVTLPIGYITSAEAGGLRKEGMLVAIGGSVGLLGQDFYGEYGIAMGSNVINLHQ